MTYTLIQAMRGLLAVGVVFAHCLIFLGVYGDPIYPEYLPDIFGGIPCMFFAISGFFMAMLVDRASPNFLPQRLLRVYPTYFIILALAYLLRSLTSMPLNFSDFFAILPLFPFKEGLDYKLGIEWTLLYEMFYYLVCAVFCLKSLRTRFPAFLTGWFLATLAGGFFLSVPPVKPSLATIWLSIWNIGFIGGALTYYFLKKERTRTILLVSLLLCLASAIAVSAISNQHVHLLLMIGLGACLSVAALVKLETVFRAPRFLVSLGDNSYALYLAHVTIILLIFDLWTRYAGMRPAALAGALAFLVSLAASWPLGRMDVGLHKRLKGYFKDLAARRRETSRLVDLEDQGTVPAAAGNKQG